MTDTDIATDAGTATTSGAATVPGPDDLVRCYEVMATIRAFENAVHEVFATGKVPGAVHLYAGQEAIAAGVCDVLRAEDYIASTHRGHGHAIAKGCDLTAMMAEVLGKDTGSCRGKGGSMHIADVERGMLGANGVAGAGAPIACGGALSAKQRGTDQVAVTFVGDGGVNQGAFAESLTLAALWKLPVVFVVEDNGYAQSTGSGYHLGGRGVAPRAEAVGIPTQVVDGSDLFAVRAAAAAAVARARAGDGPSLIECRAMRLFGHMEGWDSQGYRGPGEVDALRATRDPLAVFRERVGRAGLLDIDVLDLADAAAGCAASDALAAAERAPEPDISELTTGVYAS